MKAGCLNRDGAWGGLETIPLVIIEAPYSTVRRAMFGPVRPGRKLRSCGIAPPLAMFSAPPRKLGSKHHA